MKTDFYFKNIADIELLKKNSLNKGDNYSKNNLMQFLLSNRNDSPINEATDRKKNNFLGIFYLFISVFLLSFSHLISKFLIVYFPKIENVANNLLRGLIILVLSNFFLNKKKINLVEELKKNKDKTILLLIRCFFGSACNIILFESFKYMRISSAFTIFSTYPIFVSIFSIVFLKTKYLLFDVLSYIFCVFSVILISKPSFVFSDSGEPGRDTPYGVFLSVLSSLVNAIGVYLNKSIANDFYNMISIYFFGVWFIISTCILLPFSEYGLSNLDFQSILLITLSSLIFFFGLIFFVEALNIGEPIKVLPVFYFGIIFSLIYNCFIFGKETDIYDIIGSAIIIFFNIAGMFTAKSC